jgi:hypothetical protein
MATNGTTEVISGAKRLRQLLADPKHTVVAPGVYDGITARLALAEGFECLYMARLPQSFPINLTYHSNTLLHRPAQERPCPASAWPT